MRDLVSFVIESILKFVDPGWEWGWGNGYVIIPPDHPYYKKHHTKIPVNVHGGLTYSQDIKLCKKSSYWTRVPEVANWEGEGWIVGFDTSHAYDNEETWSKENVEIETNKLKLQLVNLYNYENNEN